MRDHVPVLHRLGQMPGVDLHATQELLAEVGPGGNCFRQRWEVCFVDRSLSGKSGVSGVCYSRRSAKGNRYLRRLLAR